MKKACLVLFNLMVFSSLFAQVTKATSGDFIRFKTSTTYVVLEQDPFSYFNSSIKSNLELFWKITPYKVIEDKEFQTLKVDSKNSFLFISLAEVAKSQAKFVWLNLCMGSNSSDVNKMPEIVSIPLAYYMDVDDEESDEDIDDPDYTYKLGGLLKTVQFYADWNIQNQGQKIEDFKKSSVSLIKDKELWLISKELPKNLQSLNLIKQIYPFAIKLVSEKEIEEAIKSNNDKVLYLHKIGPEDYPIKNAYCFKTLLSCSDGRPYYIDYHTISKDKPDAFLKDDFKNIGEAK